MATAWFVWDMSFNGSQTIHFLDVQAFAKLGNYKWKSIKSTWTTAYGLSYNDSLSYDAKKINIALAKNYKVIIVWDYEISNKNKLYNKVNELKRIINNESN